MWEVAQIKSNITLNEIAMDLCSNFVFEPPVHVPVSWHPYMFVGQVYLNYLVRTFSVFVCLVVECFDL